MNTICCSVNWGSLTDWVTAVFASEAFILSVCEYKKHKKRGQGNHLTQLSIRLTIESEISSVVKYLEALEDNNKKTMILPNTHQIELYMHFFEELCCLVKFMLPRRELYSFSISVQGRRSPIMTQRLDLSRLS